MNNEISKFAKLDGEMFISVETIRKWVADPQNLLRVALQMKRAEVRGDEAVQTLQRALLFPIEELVQRAEQSYAEITAARAKERGEVFQ